MENTMKPQLAVLLTASIVLAGIAHAAIPVPFDEQRNVYRLELRANGLVAPDVETVGTFQRHNNDKWIVGERGKGSGTWSFQLPNEQAFGDVTVIVSVYNRGEHNWAGQHATFLGTAADRIDQEVGHCWWNEVPEKGGAREYRQTFANLGARTVFVKHTIENNWFDTAQQLLSLRIVATAAPEFHKDRAPCQWSRLAVDGGGFVGFLTMDRSDPNTLYCASDKGGVHRSDDAGETWTICARGWDRETYYSCSGILVDDRNPGRVYAATGQGWAHEFLIPGALWRSDDKGNHWRMLTKDFYFSGEGNGKMTGNVLEFDPADHNVIYAASFDRGLWISRDAGQSWTPLAFPGRFLTGVRVDPDDHQRLLVSMRKDVFGKSDEPGGLFESLDGGKTWKKNLDIPQVTDVHRHPANHDWLAAATGDGVYISKDRGQTWQELTLHEKCKAVRKARWHVGHQTRLWTVGGARGLFYTDDFGKTWTWPTESIEAAFDYPDDWAFSARKAEWTAMMGAADMLIDPGCPDRMYVSDDYTPILSTDGGKTWSQRPKGINTACVYQVIPDPVDPNTIYVNNADFGLIKSTDGGKNFFWPIAEGEFAVNETTQLWINPNDNQHLILTVTYDWKNPFWTRVGVSRDGGVTWASLGEGLPLDKGGWLTGLAVLDDTGREIMVAYGGVGDTPAAVFYSGDGGETWASKSEGLPTQPGLFGSGWTALPSLACAGDKVYAVTTRGLFGCDKNEKVWRRLGEGAVPEGGLLTVAVCAARPDWVWVGGSSALYVSSDKGETFIRSGPAQLQRPQGVAINPKNPSRWVVACNQPWWGSLANVPGVYLTEDDGKSWTMLETPPCGDGMIWRTSWDTLRDDVFYIGANGSGAWRGQLPAPKPDAPPSSAAVGSAD